MSHATALSMNDLSAMTGLDSGAHRGSGGELVSVDGHALPLTRVHLSADAAGGIARVRLEQVFANPYDEPLRVTYRLPLPADGAVSGFCFRIGETRVVGEVDRKAQARERFEDAIAGGHTAALLDQERSSLFSQEVGNIPPGQDIACEIEVDQPLVWLPEGAWEWRFPTVVGARYMGAAGRVADADKLDVAVADGPLPVRATLALAVADALPEGDAPSSPSHPLRVAERGGVREICFKGDAGVRLDRDVVVRWPVAEMDVGVSLEAVRPAADAHADAAYGLLTIVPALVRPALVRPALVRPALVRPGNEAKPSGRTTQNSIDEAKPSGRTTQDSIDRTSASQGAADARNPDPTPRDLIFLIDTSGSMGGRPLDQAKRVVCAMIDTLGDRDRLELIEFGSRPRRWRREPVAATRDGRRAAQNWVRELRTSGCTEMHQAVLEAMRPLRPGCQRQVVLITDGFIGFEREIVDAIAAELPRGCRLHTIGVGGAPNRSLTRPAARVGGGVELVIGPEKDAEDAERVAQRLLARTTAPLVTDLVVTGDAVVQTAPVRLPDMFAGAPSLVSVQLDPAGGTVVVRGETAGGPFERQLQAPALTLGEGNPAIATLFGRERVEDLEVRCGARGDTRDADREIERIGLDFQIATRLTSWVAITETATVDPGGPSRRQVMPHEIPFGADIEGFGLRAGSAAPTMEPRLTPMQAQALKQRLGLGAKRPRASIKLGRAGGAMPAAPSESSDDPFAAMNALGGVGSGPPLSLDELLAAPYAPKRRQPLWPRLVLALLILAIAAAIVFGLWSWLG